MRGVLLSLTVAAFVALVAPSPASAAFVPHGPVLSTTASYDFQQNPPKDVNVDINVNQRGGYWYRNPAVWIAIGAAALVVIVLLVVVASKSGGGTTIVKD